MPVSDDELLKILEGCGSPGEAGRAPQLHQAPGLLCCSDAYDAELVALIMRAQ
jgi:hypothetical protein